MTLKLSGLVFILCMLIISACDFRDKGEEDFFIDVTKEELIDTGFDKLEGKNIDLKIEIENGNERDYNRYEFIRGTKTGWFYQVRDSMITLKARMKNEEFHGAFLTFYKSKNFRSIGNYVNGKKDGLWVQFHSNKEQINAGRWKNGIEDGLWNFYDTLGFMIEQRVYNDNQYTFLQRNKDQKLVVEGGYKDGLKNGEWKAYFKSGELKEVKNYEADKLHGAFVEYLKDGRFIKANYKLGKKDGLASFYDKDSILFKEMIFENDRILSEKEIN